MIQATECRINNRFIKEYPSPRGLGYDRDFILDEAAMGLLFGTETVLSLNDLFPIPLSPRIFERSGFKKRSDHPDCNIWDWGKDTPPLTRNKSFSLALVKDGWVYLTAPGAVPFNHVHQLQNLYFTLTGEEIVINL